MYAKLHRDTLKGFLVQASAIKPIFKTELGSKSSSQFGEPFVRFEYPTKDMIYQNGRVQLDALTIISRGPYGTRETGMQIRLIGGDSIKIGDGW